MPSGGPPFGEGSLSGCDEWCEELLYRYWHAASPEHLQRMLVFRHLSRPTNHHWEAPALLVRHHADDAGGAVDTAFLLLTADRFDRCGAKVIDGIVRTSILGDEQLCELAGWILWPDEPHIFYPAQWLEEEFGGPIIELNSETGDAAPEVERVWRDEIDPKALVRTNRSCPPPLYGWSARLLLSAGQAGFRSIERRAQALRTAKTFRAGDKAAAVMAGCLDALEALAPKEAALAIERALSWPKGPVRIRALECYAERNGFEAARRIAADDPDAAVRSWAVATGAEKARRLW